MTIIKTKNKLKYRCKPCQITNAFDRKDLKKLFVKNYIVLHCKGCGENITVLREAIFGKEK